MIDTVKPIAADQTVLEGLKGVALFMFKNFLFSLNLCLYVQVLFWFSF